MQVMRTAIYARLSKDRSGLSENCDIQIRECREFIADEGWTERITLSENDVSASKYSKKPRPRYETLLHIIERDDIDVILVTEMPRLYRRMEELLDLIKLAERTSLKRIQTTDGISYDLSTPEGVHAAIAAVNNAILESAKLSKRQKRKKKVRAEQGMFNGGGRPYGYEKDGIQVRESEAEIIRDVVRRIIAGETQMGIVRDLNTRGVPTSTGAKWTVGNFKRTIVKKRYIGVREHLEAEYPAVWLGIVAKEDHELMMARLADDAQPWSHGMVKGRQYLLSGLLECGSCGGAMYGAGRTLHDGTYQRRYRCKPMDNHGARLGCGRVFRGAEPLDAFISEVVLFRFDSPEVAAAIGPSEDPEQASDLTKRLGGYRLRAKQIAREYSLGEHSKADYSVMRDTLHEAMEATQKELAGLQSSRLAELLPRYDLIRDVWEEANLEWRRSVTKLVVEKIQVYPQGPGTKLWRGYRFDPESISVSWLV